MVPVANKTNPFGPLFDPASSAPTANAFQGDFLGQVGNLAATTIAGIGMNTPDPFNSGQSQANGSTETNCPVNLGLGRALSMRQSRSCAGCHRLSNDVPLGGDLTWPPSLGFTHVSERDVDLEQVDGFTRYRLSLALVDHFLPHRKKLVEDYLSGRPMPNLPPHAAIGGRTTH